MKAKHITAVCNDLRIAPSIVGLGRISACQQNGNAAPSQFTFAR
jgi:hypothetical protein